MMYLMDIYSEINILKIKMLLSFLLFQICFILYISQSNAILEQSESNAKIIKFSGQILPEGIYHIQVWPLIGQKVESKEKIFAKTGKDGKFEMELPKEQFEGAIYNEIQIAPIYEIETEMNEAKKRPIMKRLLNESISEEKSYKLYYGATEPLSEHGIKRWYLHGLIIDPPAFLDRWDNYDEGFQPIQVQITGLQCPDFNGPIKALNKHIKLAKVPWWNRPFAKGTPFRVDLTQMVMDSECGAKIGQLGQIEEMQIQFEAIPSKLLGWKEQHGPASYTINYPVLSGLDQQGREFRFDYEFSFFRQTKTLEGIRNTGNGPKELLEAWNGLMERVGTMQMGIFEKNDGKIMDIEAKSQETNLKGKQRQRSEKKRVDTGEARKRIEKKKTDAIGQKKNNAEKEINIENKGNLMEDDFVDIIDDAIERQTFESFEQDNLDEKSLSNAKIVLILAGRLCKALVRKSGFLSYVFEGICAKLLRKCELCALKRSERDARRTEIGAEHRGIVAEISGLVGVLDKAKVLEQFFKKLWGHYVTTMAKWLCNLAQLTTKNLDQQFGKLTKILRAIFGKSMAEQLLEVENSNSETEYSELKSVRPNKKRVRRGINDADDVEAGTSDKTPMLPKQRDCVAIRTMAELCDNGRATSDWKLRAKAEESMRAVVAAVDSPFKVRLLWSDAKEMMGKVGRNVFDAIKAIRTRQSVAFSVFAFGMALMVDYIKNTTIASVLIPVAGFTKTFSHGEFDWQVVSYKNNYSDKKESWKYRSSLVWIDHKKDLWVPWEHKETTAQVEYSKQFWTVLMVSGTIALLLLIWIGTTVCF